VTLPILLLILDFWPLARPMQSVEDLKRLLFEKWLLYPLSLASAFVTILAQSDALADPEILPLALRLENAAVAIVQYLSNHLYPMDLAVLYPLETSHSAAIWLASSVAILGLTLLFVRRRSSSPYLIAGWSWFLVALLPVLGILQVGAQARADRYTYLPSIGLFVLLVFGVWAFVQASLSERTARAVAGASLVLAVTASMVQTGHQTRYWSSSIALFEHAIEVTGGSYAAHLNLGAELQRMGQTDAAISNLRQAIERAPGLVGGHSNLASALRQAGDLEGALRSSELAVAVDPTSPKLRFNRAILLDDAKRYEEALTELTNAMALAPDTPNLEPAMVAVLSKLTPTESLRSIETSLALFPDNPKVRGLVEHLRELEAHLETGFAAAEGVPTNE
ncbi:MAG: tetratricopeptide repeat protein, partial [Thermoanaerobaculia bacterium]|nr:tetratricopeptide repeat protein [Thermoanaerobaculia bacterium]